jgi:hypothetical protein
MRTISVPRLFGGPKNLTWGQSDLCPAKNSLRSQKLGGYLAVKNRSGQESRGKLLGRTLNYSAAQRKVTAQETKTRPGLIKGYRGVQGGVLGNAIHTL